MNIRVKTATYTQAAGTLNSPSRAGTETTLLFAPTTSSRNYELLHWKRLQILILGRGRSRAWGSSRAEDTRRRDFRISRPTFRMHKSPCYFTRNAISDCMARFAIRYRCLSPCLWLSCIRLINIHGIRKNSDDCGAWNRNSDERKKNAKTFFKHCIYLKERMNFSVFKFCDYNFWFSKISFKLFTQKNHYANHYN